MRVEFSIMTMQVPSAAALDAELGGAFEDWRGQRLLLHLVAVFILGVWVVMRWQGFVLMNEPHVDEGIYLEAFQAVRNGGSPYDVVGYFYPLPVAYIGAVLVEILGEQAMLVLLRAAMVLGLATIVWCSVAWWHTTIPVRLALGVVYLTIAPGVGLGLATGNLSFAVIGMILLSLTLWRWRPIASGLGLGVSIVIKQIAPVAVAALWFHRPRSATRRHQVAGGLAVLVSSVVLLPQWSQLQQMTSQPLPWAPLNRSVSPLRILRLFDLHPNPLIITGVVLLATIVIVRRARLGQSALLAVATSMSIVALPVIWTHTFLLVLPVQVMAAWIAIRRFRHRRGGALSGETRREDARRSYYELSLVAAGILAIQLADGIGVVNNQAVWVQLVPNLVPYLAPVALSAYLIRHLPQEVTMQSESATALLQAPSESR